MVDELFGARNEPPEYYVDSVRIRANLYSFVLELGLQGFLDAPGSEPPPAKRLALLRMSPQHALVLSRLLQKHVDAYEDRIGKVSIPAEVLHDLGLDP
jgi:hypothetical protein